MKLAGYDITFSMEKGFEIKAERAQTYSGGTVGTYGDMPKSTMHLFFRYYAKNSDIRGCVRELREAVGKGGWYLQEGEDFVEEDSDLFKQYKSILNSYHSFELFKGRIIRDLMVTGNAYILKQRNLSGEIIGLQPIDPRTISIIANKYGEIMRYRQLVNGDTILFEPDDIYHWVEEQDPDNELFGLSIMEGILYDVMGDSEASITNYHYFKNNAVPATILKFDSDATEAQITETLTKMKQSFSGSRNKHKVGAIQNLAGIERLQDKTKDMDFLNLRGFTTERICGAYGVPKTILNYTDGVNYSNGDTQYKKYIEDTIRPLERRLTMIINTIMSEAFGDQVKFQLHDKHINDLEERTRVQKEQIAFGIKVLNEIREENGDELYDIPEADLPFMSRGVIPIEMSGLDSYKINNNES